MVLGGDDRGVDLGAAVQAGSHRDPAAAPAEGDPPVGRGAEEWSRARASVMASPPVQPIFSSTSGTGSVIRMWEEATVSRPRNGAPRPFAAPPIARTPRGARTRAPVAVVASTPSGASRKRATGVDS